MQQSRKMTQYQSFPDAVGGSRTLDKLMALRLPDLAGKSFLDVGCNEGFFCGFARFQGATRSVGIDYSEPFVLRARKRFPECEFFCQEWSELPAGEFDVILLASALHYADDQPALIQSLVERLSPDGTLVLELGIVPAGKPEWVHVKRDIDERVFPTMLMLQQVLAKYAWKWMGPSVSQEGDPIARHVVHISRRRPVAYLLMQPPGYGKSSIAAGLFAPAGVPVVSGDQLISLIGKGQRPAPEPLRAIIAKDYSPFRIDKITEAVFECGFGPALVDMWLAQAEAADVALDVYVPSAHHDAVESLLEARGYLPVRLNWKRVGSPPLPESLIARQSEAFYMSMLDPSVRENTRTGTCRFEPTGFVDDVRFENGQLIIRGWAIAVDGNLPGEVRVKLGRRGLPVDSLKKELRPDVQLHYGLPHALVGFRLSTGVLGEADKAGGAVTVLFEDGRSVILGMGEGVERRWKGRK